ncbi:MAG: UDP-N-acetylmuramate dehydrogenase [Proteobacteria bacterium]|nr:UDP-N-acetylmuramate dehydrogenase [Pseudomonadota bacterium]
MYNVHNNIAQMPVANELWQRDYPMARLSSWRSGGIAAWLFTPQGIGADGDNPMRTVPYSLPPQVYFNSGSQSPLFVGYGSNLLVRDGGYDGIVVRTSPGLIQLECDEQQIIYAAAGVGCPKLARFCAARGLDAAFFAGIPGTVGGALAMNAGCYGHETWEYVRSAEILQNGQVVSLQAEKFAVSYRQVQYAASEDVYFSAARFQFPKKEATEVQQNIKALLQQRQEAQPLGNACAGSVFCNPPGDYAGRLIEQCGLKNTRIGGAVVSQKHANFIINDDNASANDIEALILKVQAQVAEKTGIVLKPEVRIIGRAA